MDAVVEANTLEIDPGIWRATPMRTPPTRIVELDSSTVTVLREWLETGWVEQNGRVPGPGDLVFPNIPRGLRNEAECWKHCRDAGVDMEARPLAFTVLRTTGCLRRWTADDVELRAVADTLGHTPPQFCTADTGDSLHFQRRYLPLYGETDSDEMRRTAGDMPGFGRWAFGKRGYGWFLNQRQAHQDLWQLFWFLDSHRDAFDLTLNEAQVVFRRHAPDAARLELDGFDVLSGDEKESWLACLEEHMVGLVRSLASARGNWIRHICGDDAPHEHACGLVALERPEFGGVYFVRSRAPSDASVACKIGWGKNIRRRIHDLQTAHPWPLELLAYVPDATLQDEAELHKRFAHLRIENAPGREWFRLTGELATEIVRLRGT